VLIKKAPGGDAIDRLKTLDAKIHAAREGIKEHEAKEKMVCCAAAILATFQPRISSFTARSAFFCSICVRVHTCVRMSICANFDLVCVCW